MADGIKFLVELDGKTAGAADAVKGLKDVEHAADGAGHSLAELGRKEFPNLTRDIFKAEFALDALKEGAHLALRGIEALGDVIKETIKNAAEEERTGAVFKNMLGDDAEETLRYLAKFADLTEFTGNQAKEFGAELTRAGYRGDKFHDALEGIADAAAQSLHPLEAAQDAASAFAKMERTGKVDRRVLAGLQLDPRELTDSLANALGMSKEAVKKGLDEGTIPAAAAFGAVLDGIAKKTGKKAGEAASDMAGKMESSLTHLKDLPNRIMMGVSESQGMKDLQVGLDKMLETFNPDSETGKAMIAGLTDLIGEIGQAFKNVDWKDVGKDVQMLTDDLKGLIGPLAKTAGFIIDIYRALHEFGGRIGEQAADRGLAYQREQFRTIKNRHLTGETESAEDRYDRVEVEKKAKNDEAYQQYLDSRPKEVAGPLSSLPPAPMLTSSAMPPLPAAPAPMSSSKITTNHIGAPQVTVNLYGAHGNAQETGQAVAEGAAKGTSAAMTESLQNFSSVMERNATMSGLGP